MRRSSSAPTASEPRSRRPSSAARTSSRTGLRTAAGCSAAARISAPRRSGRVTGGRCARARASPRSAWAVRPQAAQAARCCSRRPRSAAPAGSRSRWRRARGTCRAASSGGLRGLEASANPHAGPAEQGAGRGLAAADRGGDLGAAEALADAGGGRPGLRGRGPRGREEGGPSLALEVARLGGRLSEGSVPGGCRAGRSPGRPRRRAGRGWSRGWRRRGTARPARCRASGPPGSRGSGAGRPPGGGPRPPRGRGSCGPGTRRSPRGGRSTRRRPAASAVATRCAPAVSTASMGDITGSTAMRRYAPRGVTGQRRRTRNRSGGRVVSGRDRPGAVPLEDRVPRDHGRVQSGSLGNEHPVERVPMMRVKTPGTFAVDGRHRRLDEPAPRAPRRGPRAHPACRAPA